MSGAYPVERFDGAILDDPKATEHLAFATRMDVIDRPFGERSYVIPDRCDGCARILESFQRQHTGSEHPFAVESGATSDGPAVLATPRATAQQEVPR